MGRGLALLCRTSPLNRLAHGVSVCSTSSKREIVAGLHQTCTLGARDHWARFKCAAYAVASDVGEKTIRLYRAVGETELNDILRFGDYGFAPSGGGKYFAFTEEGTRRFAGSSINLGRRVTITSIEIPEWFLQRGTRFIDSGAQGAGASIHFADVVLPDLYQTGELPHILDVSWVPQIPSGVS